MPYTSRKVNAMATNYIAKFSFPLINISSINKDSFYFVNMSDHFHTLLDILSVQFSMFPITDIEKETVIKDFLIKVKQEFNNYNSILNKDIEHTVEIQVSYNKHTKQCFGMFQVFEDIITSGPITPKRKIYVHYKLN